MPSHWWGFSSPPELLTGPFPETAMFTWASPQVYLLHAALVMNLTQDLGTWADLLTQASLPVSGCLSAVAECLCVSKWCAFRFLCECNHVCQVHTEHTPCMIYSPGLQGELPRETLAPSELITSWFWFPPAFLPLCHTYCMFQSMKAVWLLRNRAGQIAPTFALLFFYIFFLWCALVSCQKVR